eukprot:12501968-Ditylum_brightwellii.AAC.1
MSILQSSLPLLADCSILQDESEWSPDSILHLTSIWTPSPRLAWQAMSYLATTWVASPWDTSAVILIPRIFTRMWSKVNKHFRHISTVKCDNDINCPWNSPLPLCILYLPPYIRVTAVPRHNIMDWTALPSDAKWHTNQANLLCVV